MKKLHMYVIMMCLTLPITCLHSILIFHVQRPPPLYHLLGMKWYVMPTRSQSSRAVARYSSPASCGYCNRGLRFPRRITSIIFGATTKACSTRWKVGASFGGTYALTTYHLCNPDVSKKITMFGTKLTMTSTCHPNSSLLITAINPQCLISTFDAQTTYSAP